MNGNTDELARLQSGRTQVPCLVITTERSGVRNLQNGRVIKVNGVSGDPRRIPIRLQNRIGDENPLFTTYIG